MTILVEAISAIIRVDSIHVKLGRGWDDFEELIPNKTLCCDNELARLGFMVLKDVEMFITQLESKGLEFSSDGERVDIVVVEQNHGPTSNCSWVEFEHIKLNDDANQSIAACRLANSNEHQLFTPDGWEYEGSLSQTYGFIPDGQMEKSLKFLRRDAGVEVYLNEMTGKEVYVGRTGES